MAAALSFAGSNEAAAIDRRPREDAYSNPSPGDGPKGEFGGSLEFLRRTHTPPRQVGESNHFIDLWEPAAIASFARLHGLTNNRALFIDSHGEGRFRWKGSRYIMRPGAALAPKGPVQNYSIQDVRAVIGPEAAEIHNVVIAGCNLEGTIRATEIRTYFPNATNITYMAAGKLAYKPVFYQSLTEHSDDLRPLYGRITARGDSTKATISREPIAGSEPLGMYVAELFLPGATKPYRAQIAGRELLDPAFRFTAGLRAEKPVHTDLR